MVTEKYVMLRLNLKINIYCIIFSGKKNNGYNSDILCLFNLTEPFVYMIVIISTKVFYQNAIKDRKNIEFRVRVDLGKPIVFSGDVLSFTLRLV